MYRNKVTYKAAQKIRLPETEDRRRKLTFKQKAELIEMFGKVSQRGAAKIFGISRRLVIFTWHPKRLKHAQELMKERRKDGRYSIAKYHTKEQWSARQREIKGRKYRLANKK